MKLLRDLERYCLHYFGPLLEWILRNVNFNLIQDFKKKNKKKDLAKIVGDGIIK